MSQILFLGSSIHSLTKKENYLSIRPTHFSIYYFQEFKTRTQMKHLRHGSLYISKKDIHTRFKIFSKVLSIIIYYICLVP